MQRQVYMMQKDITCEKTLETYLALANVPKWHYGLKPPPNSIIHYYPFLGPLPLVNYYDRACFWSYKFPPFGIKHRKGRH
jgi:hypothetical protein